MALPPRTLDTLSDAVAMTSPSGRMSKRAKNAAQRQLSADLFGPSGLPRPRLPPQPAERDKLLRDAAMFRELAARGMRAKANLKQAAWCEARADEIDRNGR